MRVNRRAALLRGFGAAVVLSLLVALGQPVPSTTGAAGTGEGDQATVAPALELTGSRQKARLKMYPQLAHAGKKDRTARKARSVMLARFKPAREGRVVKLQQKRSWGWKTVDRGRQSRSGKVLFTARYKRHGKIQKYRAVAVRHHGLARIKTPKKRTDYWGRPDFQDNLGGRSLKSHKWRIRQSDYSAAANRTCTRVEAGAGKEPQLRHGTLRIKLLRDPDIPMTKGGLLTPPKPKNCPITRNKDWRLSQSIGTQGQHTFRYGFAAARIKFHRGDGMHTSFWLNSVKPNGGEIDVIEWFGDRDNNNRELQNCVYRWPNGHKQTNCKHVKRPHRYGNDWYRKYHVFSVEWKKRKAIFRIDGKTVRKVKGVPRTDMYLVLSTFSSDWEYKRAHPRDLPQRTKVDWVRFWDRNRHG